MALTPLDYLAQAHHREQARLALVATQRVRRAMRGVDLRDRYAVGAAVRTVTPTLLQQRAASINAARPYYERARRVVGFDTPYEWIEAERGDAAAERLATSLYVLARGRLQKRLSDRSYERAYETNVDEMAGAAVRHTLDGGRESIIETVKRDRTAVGFVRVTAQDAKVCYFCAMLASREDYKATSFDRSDPRFAFGGNPLANAKVHDRCRCSIRPVFIDEATPDATMKARDLWYSLSEGDGREALRSFRRNYEALLRSGAPVW